MNAGRIRERERVPKSQRLRWSVGSFVSAGTETVTTLFARLRIERLEMLKIDCEGCEFEVVPDLFARGVLHPTRIKIFVGEDHTPWCGILNCGNSSNVSRPDLENFLRREFPMKPFRKCSRRFSQG